MCPADGSYGEIARDFFRQLSSGEYNAIAGVDFDDQLSIHAYLLRLFDPVDLLARCGWQDWTYFVQERAFRWLNERLDVGTKRKAEGGGVVTGGDAAADEAGKKKKAKKDKKDKKKAAAVLAVLPAATSSGLSSGVLAATSSAPSSPSLICCPRWACGVLKLQHGVGHASAGQDITCKYASTCNEGHRLLRVWIKHS